MYRTVGFCGAGNLIARRINYQVSGRLRSRDIWRERGFWLAWVACRIGRDGGNRFAIGLWRGDGDGK